MIAITFMFPDSHQKNKRKILKSRNKNHKDVTKDSIEWIKFPFEETLPSSLSRRQNHSRFSRTSRDLKSRNTEFQDTSSTLNFRDHIEKWK